MNNVSLYCKIFSPHVDQRSPFLFLHYFHLRVHCPSHFLYYCAIYAWCRKPRLAAVNRKRPVPANTLINMSGIVGSMAGPVFENGSVTGRSYENPSSPMKRHVEIVDLVGESSEGGPSPPKKLKRCPNWHTALAARKGTSLLKVESNQNSDPNVSDALPLPSALITESTVQRHPKMSECMRNSSSSQNTSLVTSSASTTAISNHDTLSRSGFRDGRLDTPLTSSFNSQYSSNEGYMSNDAPSSSPRQRRLSPEPLPELEWPQVQSASSSMDMSPSQNFRSENVIDMKGELSSKEKEAPVPPREHPNACRGEKKPIPTNT